MSSLYDNATGGPLSIVHTRMSENLTAPLSLNLPSFHGLTARIGYTGRGLSSSPHFGVKV